MYPFSQMTDKTELFETSESLLKPPKQLFACKMEF